MNRPHTVTPTPASPVSHLAGTADAGCTRLRLTAALQIQTAASRTQINGQVVSATQRHRATGSTRSVPQRARIT